MYKYEHIKKIRELELDLENEYDEQKKKEIKFQLTHLRKMCLSEYENVFKKNNEFLNKNLMNIETGHTFLDGICLLYNEGEKYKKHREPQDIENLVNAHLTYIHYMCNVMWDNIFNYKNAKNGEYEEIYSYERINKLFSYYKRAEKLYNDWSHEGPIKRFKQVDQSSFDELFKILLRFDAYGYFLRARDTKAKNKEVAIAKRTEDAIARYHKLLEDPELKKDYSFIAALHMDMGEFYEWLNLEDIAVISYEKALNTGSNIQEATEKINKLRSKT